MKNFFSCLFNKIGGSLQQSDTRGDWKDLREQAKLTLQRIHNQRLIRNIYSFINVHLFQEIFIES